MMDLRLGSLRVRCSILLLLTIPLAVLFRRETMLAVAFISLSVHEGAHAMLAHRLGFSVHSIEIQPFGFVARLDSIDAPAGDLAAVYAAGPVASIVMAAMSSLMEKYVPVYAEASLGFTQYNLLIAVVNLLPAVPLDGGRLVYAALMDRSRRHALKILKIFGIAVGAAFIALFGFLAVRGAINPTIAIMGIFLIIAALKENDRGVLPERRLRRGCIPVRELAADENTAISTALLMLPPGSYAVLNVLDGSMRRIAVLDERRLIEAAGILGASASLSDAVALYPDEVV